MNLTPKSLTLALVGAAALAALAVFVTPIAGQSAAETETKRFLKGAIDMHFHMDPPTPNGRGTQADIAQVRIAKGRGLRGLVLKHHNETTGALAYHLRLEIPNFELFGGTVMNLSNGGIDPAMVEFMATQIKGNPGRVVWMPAGDTETEIKSSNRPNRPFVPVVGKDGQLLPGVREIVSTVAKNNLILASGHILAKEALLLFTDARKAGVKHMIATHAMDLTGKMTIPQMKEAAALGAIVEFDFRNIFDDNAVRADAIRAVGPEHCLISEFWTKNNPREYGAPEGTYAFILNMRKKGFTDRELDIMVKDNPAKLLDLAPTQ
jgi:hypothetical protein